MKAIEKWLWTRLNKNPPKLSNAYMSVVVSWVYVGALFTVVVMLMCALINEGNIVSGMWKAIVVVVLLCLLVIWLGYISYREDRKRGNCDAIHKASVEYWHKKRKEYGLE